MAIARVGKCENLHEESFPSFESISFETWYNDLCFISSFSWFTFVFALRLDDDLLFILERKGDRIFSVSDG